MESTKWILPIGIPTKLELRCPELTTLGVFVYLVIFNKGTLKNLQNTIFHLFPLLETHLIKNRRQKICALKLIVNPWTVGPTSCLSHVPSPILYSNSHIVSTQLS